MHLREGPKFQPQQATEIGSFGHMDLVLESSGGRKRLWNLPLHLRKATEARCVSGMFLNGGPERLLFVKL